jgi:hypothetical protein
MRINERKLRSIIRTALLQESSITQRAADLGFAVCVTGSPGSAGHLMLYDLQLLKNLAQFHINSKTKELFEDVLAKSKFRNKIVQAGISWNPIEEPCNYAKVVQNVASIEGSKMGPVVYELAMWLTAGLAPDRFSVSASAADVWKRFELRTTDVVREPFDDIDDPKTPPVDDDCIIQREQEKRQYLDSSYRLKEKPSGLDEMLRRHEEFEEFCYDAGIGNISFTIFLLYYQLFESRYVQS